MNDFCEGCNQRFAPIDQQACWGCKDGDLNSSKREITSNNAQIFATDNKDGRKVPANVPETNVWKINGRTPDEIKKGILCDCPCNECAYRERMMSDGGCSQAVTNDTIDYIQQLEAAVEFYSNTTQMLDAKIAKLETRLAQVEREKDAAVAEIKRMEAKTEELRDMVNDVIHRELPYSDYLDFINQVDQICNYQFENEWRGN